MNTKIKNIIIGSALALPLLALQSFHVYRTSTHGGNLPSNNERSVGAANALDDNYTGSDTKTCNDCHGGGSFTNTLATAVITNSLGNIVTSYMPGEQLTVEFIISADGGPSGYGSQLTLLDDNKDMAGSLSSPETSNTQVSTVNSVEFLEHSGVSSSGVFRSLYTAPIQGTGKVTLYGVGMAVNGSGTSGDNVSQPVQLILNEDVATSVFDPISIEELSVFPNPSISGVFSIKGKVASVEVTDLNGEVILKESLLEIIDLGSFKDGVYLVKATMINGDVIIKKIIK
jgi:hypothetical protein